jgi:hypothetical protein
MQPTWIHVAGIASNLSARRPPFWRYRLGPTGEEHPLNSWEVSGVFTSNNNTHGSQADAGFRLWVALYGTVREEIHPITNEKSAHFTLAVPSTQTPSREQPLIPTGKDHQVQLVRMYAAADLVQQQSPYHWRCDIHGKITELRSFTLYGEADTTNFFPDSDMQQQPARLWLAVRGQVHIDKEKNATFLLE